MDIEGKHYEKKGQGWQFIDIDKRIQKINCERLCRLCSLNVVFFFNLTICDNQNIKLLLPGTLITSKLQVIFTENWCFLSVSQKQCLFLLFELSWQRIRLQCRRPGFYPWVGKIPRRRERLPTPVFWLGEFLACYSSWCHKELHITK